MLPAEIIRTHSSKHGSWCLRVSMYPARCRRGCGTSTLVRFSLPWRPPSSRLSPASLGISYSPFPLDHFVLTLSPGPAAKIPPGTQLRPEQSKACAAPAAQQLRISDNISTFPPSLPPSSSKSCAYECRSLRGKAIILEEPLHCPRAQGPVSQPVIHLFLEMGEQERGEGLRLLQQRKATPADELALQVNSLPEQE